MLMMLLYIHIYISQYLQDNASRQISFTGIRAFWKLWFACNTNYFIFKGIGC